MPELYVINVTSAIYVGRVRFREKKDLSRFVRARPRVGPRCPESGPGLPVVGSTPIRTLGSPEGPDPVAPRPCPREPVLPRGALTGLGRSPEPKGRRGSRGLFLAA